MRWSRYFLYTSKEEPAEAEAPSHRLLLKAGFIKQVAAGIYELLPPALRVLKKIEGVVRREMDRSGAQELLLTVLNPKELWLETGRWDAYGDELFKLKDRHGREYCLGPTHEEEITDLIRKTVRSYRQLPLLLYQIQVKFRDEKRPRFGLIRAREFIMKDAYSFDADEESAELSYESMRFAYERIFKKLGLKVVVAEADVGQIGGKLSHEFIALTPYGEAKLAYCESCSYAANAEVVPVNDARVWEEEERPLKEVETPGVRTIEELARFLGVEKERIVKAVVYAVKGEPVVVFIRGDREVDENKLEKLLGTDEFRLATDEEVRRFFGTERGFIGPVGLKEGTRVFWDRSVEGIKNAVVAFNEPDKHLVNANPGRDFSYGPFVDLAQVREGDACPRCGEPLRLERGLELGHTFLLGTRYSEPMKAYFTDRDGREKPVVMGCYGIGISRVLAAIVEQHHDEKGIKWPTRVAPFELLIILLNPKDEELTRVAEELYREALAEGLEVLYDDRDERAGFKFADADLVGIPYRLVVGKKVKEGSVELQSRLTGERWELPLNEAVSFVKRKVEEDKR
ncbi:MAG: proline--tRNA ligase [Aquificae bacterium]|nr:proline--tRNA ligase [Aquificota bacterium]